MRIFIGVVVFVLAMLVLFMVLTQSGVNVRQYIPYAGDTMTIYVNQTPIMVRVADTPAEREQGLSGTTELAANEGLLFIFEQSGRYGFWMKDMNYPIDILWFDESLTLVHIEKNVSPSTYPTSFASAVPARFVLEVNAYVADSFNFTTGATLTLPSSLIPADIRQRLQ